MSDDLERRLAESLRSERLPDAPDDLRAFLERLPAAAASRPPQRRFRLAWLVPVVAVVMAAALILALVPRGSHPSAASPTPAPSAENHLLNVATLYTATFIAPTPNEARRTPNGAWSPDGNFLAAMEEASTGFTIHVFDSTNHEVWHHAGRFAAWVGPGQLAILVPYANDLPQTHLSIVTLPSGQLDNLPGTYGASAFMLAAPDGTLAVATDTGFALVKNGPIATYDGDPLAWSPDGHLLAFGTLTGRPHQELLNILDVTSGHILQTGIRVLDQGVTWDRTGTKILVGMIPTSGNPNRPTLVDAASGATLESPLQSYFSGAAQLVDGRWVLWTDPEAFLWDPAHPQAVTALGYGISVTLDGLLVAFEPPPSTPTDSSPVPLPSLLGVTVYRFDTPLPDFLAWAPGGDRIAYTVGNAQQVDLRVAVTGLAQRHGNEPSGSEVPALTVDHPQVTVTPATNLHDGETVTVQLTGFGVGGKVFLSECATAAAASDLGCGAELAAQPFVVTDDTRAGSTSLVVKSRAASGALASPVVACADQCVIVATVGGGYGFAFAPIVFGAAPTGSVPATAAACTTDQLAISVVGTGAGLGHVTGWLRFVNAGSQPCTLRGYPSLVAVTAAGASTVAKEFEQPWGGAPIDGTPTVTLLPGESALAQYSAGDTPVGSADTCPAPYRTLRVTPPDGTGFVSVSAWNTYLGAYGPSCVGITVTPVVAASAQPDVDLQQP